MTAKEFINKILDTRPIKGSRFQMIEASDKQVEAVMIEFAKIHVRKALEAARKQAPYCDWTFKSILNAYPIDKIK